MGTTRGRVQFGLPVAILFRCGAIAAVAGLWGNAGTLRLALAQFGAEVGDDDAGHEIHQLTNRNRTEYVSTK